MMSVRRPQESMSDIVLRTCKTKRFLCIKIARKAIDSLAPVSARRYHSFRFFPLSFMATVDTPSQNNPWFAVSIGLMGLILGFSIASFTGSNLGLRIPSNPSVPSVPEVPTGAQEPVDGPVPEVTAEDHIRGSLNAKAIVVEYMDFECPFCHRNSPTVKTVLDTYGDDVAHVIRHFPLDFHPAAMPYARASECVASLGGEGAFWKFYDAIFGVATPEIDVAKLPEIAKNIGVNSTKFDECYKGTEFDAKIQAQQQGGVAAGINGTPGIAIVNTATKEQTRLPGAVPFSDYKAAIDPILQ